MKTPARLATGFTLVELLVTIAIIAIIAAIAVPAFSRAQESSREAAGVQNLRQIMNATLSYMNDNNNRFPKAYTSDKIYWFTELSGYLAQKDGVGTTWDKMSKVFQDPAATIKKGANHFTMNANIGFYYNQANNTQPTPLIFSKPSEVIVFFDGAQAYNGEVDSFGWAVDKGSLNGLSGANATAWFGASVLDRPVDKGPNTDQAKGNIRWRNRNDTAAKFAFLDGRVAVLKPEETKRRSFMLP
jgi:prepilin-type N-terminal cleavage/methylation domain-containing protein